MVGSQNGSQSCSCWVPTWQEQWYVLMSRGTGARDEICHLGLGLKKRLGLPPPLPLALFPHLSHFWYFPLRFASFFFLLFSYLLCFVASAVQCSFLWNYIESLNKKNTAWCVCVWMHWICVWALICGGILQRVMSITYTCSVDWDHAEKIHPTSKQYLCNPLVLEKTTQACRPLSVCTTRVCLLAERRWIHLTMSVTCSLLVKVLRLWPDHNMQIACEIVARPLVSRK